MPRIHAPNAFVDDQAKALAFYTEKLGFVAKTDVPVGEFRWLTVAGGTEPDGAELLLEPVHQDLQTRGVRFTQAPTAMGPYVTAVLDETCGNLIQLASPA